MILLTLQGRFKYQPGQVRAFGMLAGGTGITPMFQVWQCGLKMQNFFITFFLYSATSRFVLISVSYV